LSFDPLAFAGGVFYPLPSPQWRLTFNRPVTDWDLPLIASHWATVRGVTTTPATAVSVVGGIVRISHAAYTATDEHVLYAGPPPQYRDAEGFILAGFYRPLPGS